MFSTHLFNKTNRLLLQIILFNAIFFSAIAIIQYLVVENETRKASFAQLDSLSAEVLQGLDYIDHWDAKKYRQAAIAQGSEHFGGVV